MAEMTVQYPDDLLVRLGRLPMGKHTHRTLMTPIPEKMNQQLPKLQRTALFATPPPL